jgi:hypothetical protein
MYPQLCILVSICIQRSRTEKSSLEHLTSAYSVSGKLSKPVRSLLVHNRVDSGVVWSPIDASFSFAGDEAFVCSEGVARFTCCP